MHVDLNIHVKPFLAPMNNRVPIFSKQFKQFRKKEKRKTAKQNTVSGQVKVSYTFKDK